MHAAMLMAILINDPSVCMDHAERTNRPCLVFMCTPPVYSEAWVTCYKCDKMPLPSILVYMPDDRGHMVYIGWVTNIECAKFRIEEQRRYRR